MAFQIPKTRRKAVVMADPSEGITLPSDMLVPGVIPYNSPNTHKKTELMSITDKINRALNEIDKMYDPTEEDTMLQDISVGINGLESGELKYQLKGFVNKYKDISNQVDAANSERDQMVNSLADWFNSTQMDVDTMVDYEDNEDIQQSLIQSKVGFDKLKKMNEEIEQQKSQGRNVQHLEKEKQNLQTNVMKQFNEYKTAAAAHNETKQERQEKDEVNQAWKHAATEICDILNKVRHEGTDYAAELEKKINGLVKNLEMQAAQIKRLKAEIRSKELLESKWQEDCILVTNEKADLTKKNKTLKKELKSTRKSLGKYEAVSSGSSVDFEDDCDGGMNRPRLGGGGGRLGANNDPAVLRAQLRESQKQVDTLTEDVRHYQEKTTELTDELEEKSDDIQRLEQDKKELMHQMKQSSVRPDMRRLSYAGSSINNNVGFPGGAVSGVGIGRMTSDRLLQIVGSSNSISNLQQNKLSSLNDSDASKHLETNYEKALKSKIEDLHTQLTKAHSELRELKVRTHAEASQLRSPTPVSTDQVEGVSVPSETQSQQEETPTEVAESDSAQLGSDKPARKTNERSVKSASKNRKERQTRSQNRNRQREADKQLRAAKEVAEAKQAVLGDNPDQDVVFIRLALNKEITLVNTTMQTDPSMDPCASWSQPMENNVSGWKPPLPPNQWLDFDPTCTEGPQSAVGDGVAPPPTIAEKMLACMEPAELRNNTTDCANFMHREMMRMRLGIKSFVEFTNSLVDREAKLMASANRQLREQLSKMDMDKLERDLVDQVVGTDMPSDDAKIATNYGLGLAHPTVKSGAARFRNHGGLGAAVANQTRTGDIMSTSQTLLTPTSVSPVEERIKYQVIRIGQDAVNTLKRTHDIVLSALQSQHRQYEHIFSLMKTTKPQIISEAREKIMRLTKSKSHTEILPPGDTTVAIVTVSTTNAADLVISHSRSILSIPSITSLDHSLPPSRTNREHSTMFGRGGANLNKEELRVGMATTPKKGLITLTTGQEEEPFSGPDFDRVRRKYKPAPMNHQKLQQKQQQLAEAMGGKTTKESTGRRKHAKAQEGLTKYELPPNFFQGYTVRDLEKSVGANITSELKSRDRQNSIATTMQTVTRLPKLPDHRDRHSRFTQQATQDLDSNRNLEFDADMGMSALPPLNTEWAGIMSGAIQ